jgi:CheY-like chemotaxis protein
MTALQGLRILVVEDELLLALSLEQDLMTAGCSVVGPFTTLTSAKEAARREQFDLATLDINLNGQMVFPLAEELLARCLPFVFVTGYAHTDLPEQFRAHPRVPKPYDPPVLIQTIAQLLAK